MLAMLDRTTRERLVLPARRRSARTTCAPWRARPACPRADAVESQEVCFVGEGGYAPFLERTGGLVSRPGPIEDAGGRRLGTHGGYWRFTVGQRRGIGVAGAEPLYVLSTDAARNAVVVGPREDLAVHAVSLDPARLHGEVGGGPARGAPALPRPGAAGRASRPTADGVRIALDDPADGVAAGQTAALYRDGRLVAAGTIAASQSDEAPHGRRT